MKKTILLLSIITLIVGCNDSKKMEPQTKTAVDSTDVPKHDMLEKNKAVAIAAEKAFNDHDATAILGYLSDDAVDNGDASMNPIKGKEAIKTSLVYYFKAFPDVHAQLSTILAEGNQVAVFSAYTATFSNELMGIKPTGKQINFNDVDLFTFNDVGKITEHNSVQNFENVIMHKEAKK